MFCFVEMPLMVGGGDGRAATNVMCCFLLTLAAAVVLSSAGVAASPDEHKPVQEQPPQDVQAVSWFSPTAPLTVVGSLKLTVPG